MPQIIVIAHDIRSCHNVGSLLRTADGFGVQKVYLTGYTPHPKVADDDRMPHIITKLTKDIHKTALGAEDLVPWGYRQDPTPLIDELKLSGYTVYGLEQTSSSVQLPALSCPEKAVLLLGREVEGVAPELLSRCDVHLEIPMLGKKESFNVIQAAAVALYQMTFC